MGLRYRKSFKAAPGVRVNLNKKSASITVGGRAARVTHNTNGQTTIGARTPVKGLSYRETIGRSHTPSRRPYRVANGFGHRFLGQPPRYTEEPGWRPWGMHPLMFLVILAGIVVLIAPFLVSLLTAAVR